MATARNLQKIEVYTTGIVTVTDDNGETKELTMLTDNNCIIYTKEQVDLLLDRIKDFYSRDVDDFIKKTNDETYRELFRDHGIE